VATPSIDVDRGAKGNVILQRQKSLNPRRI
jgi:hypothetical protein